MSERDEFEAWAKSQGMPLCMSMALTVADLRETNRAWAAWQAARATPQQEVPEGWKLVPVEPTKDMIKQACKDHGYPGGDSSIYRRGYKSMLAVAQQPSQEPEKAPQRYQD